MRQSRKILHRGDHIPSVWAKALAAGAAIAADTHAYAEPIRFDNPLPEEPGHFDWGTGEIIGAEVMLNVLAPASEQPPPDADDGVFTQTFIGIGRLDGELSSRVELDSLVTFLVGHEAGTLIPTGAYFGGSGYLYYPGGYGLPEAQPVYLGVRFDLGIGLHYGWIGVERTGEELQAFAWGYETEPGVAIPAGAIPEPGTLTSLALGFVALTARRRKPNV